MTDLSGSWYKMFNSSYFGCNFDLQSAMAATVIYTLELLDNFADGINIFMRIFGEGKYNSVWKLFFIYPLHSYFTIAQISLRPLISLSLKSRASGL